MIFYIFVLLCVVDIAVCEEPLENVNNDQYDYVKKLVYAQSTGKTFPTPGSYQRRKDVSYVFDEESTKKLGLKGTEETLRLDIQAQIPFNGTTNKVNTNKFVMIYPTQKQSFDHTSDNPSSYYDSTKMQNLLTDLVNINREQISHGSSIVLGNPKNSEDYTLDNEHNEKVYHLPEQFLRPSENSHRTANAPVLITPPSTSSGVPPISDYQNQVVTPPTKDLEQIMPIYLNKGFPISIGKNSENFMHSSNTVKQNSEKNDQMGSETTSFWQNFDTQYLREEPKINRHAEVRGTQEVGGDTREETDFPNYPVFDSNNEPWYGFNKESQSSKYLDKPKDNLLRRLRTGRSGGPFRNNVDHNEFSGHGEQISGEVSQHSDEIKDINPYIFMRPQFQTSLIPQISYETNFDMKPKINDYTNGWDFRSNIYRGNYPDFSGHTAAWPYSSTPYSLEEEYMSRAPLAISYMTQYGNPMGGVRHDGISNGYQGMFRYPIPLQYPPFLRTGYGGYQPSEDTTNIGRLPGKYNVNAGDAFGVMPSPSFLGQDSQYPIQHFSQNFPLYQNIRDPYTFSGMIRRNAEEPKYKVKKPNKLGNMNNQDKEDDISIGRSDTDATVPKNWCSSNADNDLTNRALATSQSSDTQQVDGTSINSKYMVQGKDHDAYGNEEVSMIGRFREIYPVTRDYSSGTDQTQNTSSQADQ